MKKLFTFILASLFCIGLFAEPKVPKYFFDDSGKKEDEFVYISNDLMYCYTVSATYDPDAKKNNYKLRLIKTSLLYDSSMALLIYFDTEKQLDDFSKTIHLSDIENEFNRIRRLMVVNNAKQNPTQPNFEKQSYDNETRPSYIFYQIEGSKL